MNLIVKLANSNDFEGIKRVLDSTNLFPSEMLPEMMQDYLNNPESEEVWFCATLNDKIVAFAYVVPEKLTDGTYNLLAIATLENYQHKGVGTKMMNFIELHLEKLGKRILIIDTSSSEEYKQTRQFYTKLGYNQEAIIRDFWKEGEDKVVFWKKLTEVRARSQAKS